MLINYNNNLSFGAKKISTFLVDKIDDKINSFEKNEIEIYSLEKRDIPCLIKLAQANENNDLFSRNISTKNDFENLKTIIDVTIKNIIATIKIQDNLNLPYKPINLVAVSNDNIVGLISALTPKISKDLKIIYSTSGKKGEVETDWCACWPDRNNMRYKGLGKVLIGSMIDLLKKSKFPFTSLYSRSEIPEKSVALNFYQSLGFKKINKKIVMELDKKSDPVELNLLCMPEERQLSKDLIIPMRINARDAIQTADKLFEIYKRRESKTSEISYDLEEIIK